MGERRSLLAKLILCSLLAILVWSLSGQSMFATKAAIETAPPYSRAMSEDESPLRFSEPVDAVVADLRVYIPKRMREADVPGLAVALIRGRRVAWTEGFGVANTIAVRPVTPDAVFEVASISKVATAYVALRLVDQGRLSLDEPVGRSLPKPWLPQSE